MRMKHCSWLFLLIYLVLSHSFTHRWRVQRNRNNVQSLIFKNVVANDRIEHNKRTASDKEEWAPFEQSLILQSVPASARSRILSSLRSAGFENWIELSSFGKDFTERPEVLSSLLQSDFGFTALDSHRARAAILHMISKRNDPKGVVMDGIPKVTTQSESSNNDSIISNSNQTLQKTNSKSFKSVIVNANAKKRRNKSNSTKTINHEYGLPPGYEHLYPCLASELQHFLSFMMTPTAFSQEAPIRRATAEVYLRHAKLFLGWYATTSKNTSTELSLFEIIPSKERSSASILYDFVLWLRSTRHISKSYEANLLRGLLKLAKFRFAKESSSDPSYGQKSFEDIPAIREMRKLHREANRQQTLSPRSSNEDLKWLQWEDYLQVIQMLKQDLQNLISQYNQSPNKQTLALRKKIATLYQHYLILAFFSCVPDRQRTVRELEIDKTFLRDDQNQCWMIKHGPDDYKTGKTYGDRPPLLIATEFTPCIDDFIEQWRDCLNQNDHNYLFIQPRTGAPLTQDSVYQIVVRSCYKYTGKRTNPHLLRDMVVTHIRECSNASQKQLEALALYMGHSMNMQRTSYDRRTMVQKVAPAVELLQSVNSKK